MEIHSTVDESSKQAEEAGPVRQMPTREAAKRCIEKLKQCN